MILPSRIKKWFYLPLELLDSISLRLGGERWRRWKLESKNCSTAGERFDFANDVFYACQKKNEMVGFLDYLAKLKPKVVVEIGVAKSGTSYLLSQCSTSVELFVGIDYFVRNVSKLRAFTPTTVQLYSINGYSTAGSTIDKLERYLNGRKIDLLFIDGDHTYEGVKNDLMFYLPFLASNGHIAFHDILPAHREADGGFVNGWVIEVDQLWLKVKLFGPYREFVESTTQHANGIGIVTIADSSALLAALKSGNQF